MTRAMLLIAAALIVSPALGENWQTVNVTQNGTIIEIDMDSIRHSNDGSARVTVSTGAGEALMFFDCKGRYRMSARLPLVHIPHLSIAEDTANIVCAAPKAKQDDASPPAISNNWGHRWNKRSQSGSQPGLSESEPCRTPAELARGSCL